ncbi:DUF2141 domain-containing protein [Niveibacterium sp. SC-1]|uniref:DUF2141 domain-containing protein n=1 Tax=Niveibacterium sp. SC-1 TaxID=3135646 RepID=UPI00311D679A
MIHRIPCFPARPRAAASVVLRAAALAAAILFAGGATAQTSATPAVPFEVVLAPVRSATGSVRLSVYGVPATFRKEAQALKVIEVPASVGEVRVRVEDLPAGRYALMAYHDENGNGKLDLRLGMFPIEGHGLSNNPKVIGPPAFEDSAFAVEQAGQVVTIEMRY